MRTITHWFCIAVFAAAQKCLPRLVRPVGDRLETSTLVRTVTKWLALAASAGAPVVCFTLDKLDLVRRFLRNNGFFTHIIPHVYKVSWIVGLDSVAVPDVEMQPRHAEFQAAD
jgi:hypothetical protein